MKKRWIWILAACVCCAIVIGVVLWQKAPPHAGIEPEIDCRFGH